MNNMPTIDYFMPFLITGPNKRTEFVLNFPLYK